MSGYSSNPYAQRPPANPAYRAYPTPSTSSALPAAAPLAYPSYAPNAYAQPAHPAYPQYPATPAGPSFDPSFAAQASAYSSDAYLAPPAGPGPGPEGAKAAKPKPEGRKTVLRKGGGEVWEDQTLLEWDPSHFRLFVGDLDPALSDELFEGAFRGGGKYQSFVKAKIIREKHSNKGKGFGFVSYSDPEDFLKAWKDLNGKYIGTVSRHPQRSQSNATPAELSSGSLPSQRPVTIKKATATVGAVNIGARKAAEFDAKHKKKTGTVPYGRANDEAAVESRLDGARSGGYGPERSRGKSYIRR